MLASVPVNLQAHDTYFTVAHFHYVLIGGWLFPTIGGIYYWFPKFANRMPNERLGKWNFWLLFIGFNLAFFPMHISGILGMVRRIYTYEAGLGLEVYNMLSTIGAFTIAASFVVFLYNIFSSARNGIPASDNPWNADTLEWSTPTPMPDYGFRKLPIVRSRHPLWDMTTPDDALNARTEKILEVLQHYPLKYRAQLGTTAIEAQPEEVFRVAGPSIFPFLSSVAIAALTLALVFSQYALSAVFLVVTFLTLAGWHRDADDHSDPAEELAFEREYGIPLRPHGSRAVSRWGMVLTIVTLSTAFATMAFSYLFLRLKPPQWPPEGIALPDPLLPAIALVILLASVIPMHFAARGVEREQSKTIQWGLLAVVMLGVVYVGVNLFSYTQLGFNYQTQAFGSIFAVLAAFQMLTTIFGAAFVAFALYGLVRRRSDERLSRHRAVTDIALLWYYIAVVGVLTFALLYIAPIVI